MRRRARPEWLTYPATDRRTGCRPVCATASAGSLGRALSASVSVGQLVAAFGLDDVAGLGEFAQRRAGAPAGDPGGHGDLPGRLRAALERLEDLRARLTAWRRCAR